MLQKKRKISSDYSTYHPVLFSPYSNDIVIDNGEFGTTVKKPVNTSTYSPQPDDYADLDAKDLTAFTMQASEESLAKVWDEEDDDYWESFL